MNYLAIDEVSFSNGTGARVVLWVAGCNHHCPNCHNPQTHSFDAGQPFTEDTLYELMRLIEKPYIKGLTISGGDPLDPKNIETVEFICRFLKQFISKSFDIWIYTGFIFEKLVAKYKLDFVDYIVDGEYVEALRSTLAFRGSSNQRIIKVKDFSNFG